MINVVAIFLFFDLLAFTFASWGLGSIIINAYMATHHGGTQSTPLGLKIPMVISLVYMITKAIT